MHLRCPQSRILLFCRVPEPGRVKSRLAAALGEEGAARLHAWMVRNIVEVVSDAALAPLEIQVTPSAGHAFFDPWRARDSISLRDQEGADLGAIMGNAAARTLESADRVLLIGADCPALTAEHLEESLARLGRGDEAVLIPADDGGYVLLGLSRCDESLFHGIPWGSAHVCEETRARLRALGWRWSELAPLWDVDRPGDLSRLDALGFSVPGVAPGRSG